MKFNTHGEDFGMLIPRDNGVKWAHQAGGMSCANDVFEGIFVPLSTPSVYLNGECISLVEERRLYDYEGDDSRCSLDWEDYEEVRDALFYTMALDVEVITPGLDDIATGKIDDRIPDDQPRHGTAHEWVVVKGVREGKKLYDFDVEAITGEVVAILYENVD